MHLVIHIEYMHTIHVSFFFQYSTFTSISLHLCNPYWSMRKQFPCYKKYTVVPRNQWEIGSRSPHGYQNYSRLKFQSWPSQSTVPHSGFNQLRILQYCRYLLKKSKYKWTCTVQTPVGQGYIARIELNNICVVPLISEIIYASKNKYLFS